MKFRGWIPAVAGRLSFSALGKTTSTGVVVSENLLAPARQGRDFVQRRAALLQKRNTLDTPFKSATIARQFKLRGKFLFCFVGKTLSPDESDGESVHRFTGKVLIFEDRQPGAAKVASIIESFGNNVSQWAIGTLNDSSIEEEAREAVLALTELAVARADVEFDRSGITTIQNIAPRSKNAFVFEGDFNDRADLTDGDKLSFERMIVAKQIFFFLRDVLHSHRHHHIQSDAIVSCHEVHDPNQGPVEGLDEENSEEEPELSCDTNARLTRAEKAESSWRRETLYDLFRYVIYRRDGQSIQSLNNILGVLAYAESFQRICFIWITKQSRKKSEPDYVKNIPFTEETFAKFGLPFYEPQHLSESVGSVINSRKERLNSYRWFYSTLVAMILFGLALVRIAQGNHAEETRGLAPGIVEQLAIIVLLSENILLIFLGGLFMVIMMLIHIEAIPVERYIFSISLRRIIRAIPYGREIAGALGLSTCLILIYLIYRLIN